MDHRELHPWDVTPAAARELQEELRDEVVRRPPPGFEPGLVAGADLSVDRERGRCWAALSVLDRSSLETVAEVTVGRELAFPYVPGLLSFRELPPLAAAWERLEVRPELILFDGHGLAHPRRFGLACHGGLLFDVPSLGCAKSVLVGEHDEPGEERGSTAPLKDGDETVGLAVRTRTGVRPVFLSVGHRMDLETGVRLLLDVSPRYRVPEPVRRADRAAGRARSEASGRADDG